MEHEYIIGSIRVTSPTTASMEGRYSVWGVAELDCDSSIIIKNTDDIASQVTVRAFNNEDVPSTLDVFNSIDLEAKMSIKQGGYLNTHAKLAVTPKNNMWGQYEVIEPVPMTQKVFAEKDTFIRSQRPRVNYGRDGALIVGNNFGDEYRSLIKYNFDDIPQDVEVKSATLVLKGIENINQFLVDIHNVLDPWEEYSTTWVNSPRVGEILQSFTSGNTVNEVRVDITSLYFAWVDGVMPNNGMYFLKNDSGTVGTRTYGSRESNITHYVEVEYLNPNLYSFNNNYIWSMLEVGYYKDLDGKIDVKPTEWEVSVDANIYVRDPKNMPSQFVVNKPNLHAVMMVKYAKDFDLLSYIRVPEYADDDLLTGEAYIRAIGTKDLPSVVDVEYKHLMETVIEVRPTLSTPSILMIPYPEVYDGLEGIIEIMDGFNRPAELTVASVFEIEGSIHVASVDDIPTSVFVKYEQDWEAKVRITPVLDTVTSIGVKVDGEDEWQGQFTATIFKDIAARFKVNPYEDLPSTVGVKVDGQSEWGAELKVDYGLNLPSVMYVRGDDMDATMVVRALGDEDVEVQFLIRFEDHLDIKVELNPRVDGKFDQPSKLRPRVAGVHYSAGFFRVRVADTFDLDVVMEVEEIKFRGYVFIM